MSGLHILMVNHSWLAPELRARGHRVMTVGNGTPYLDCSFESTEVCRDEILAALPASFHPDRIVYHDNSGVPWITDLEHFDVPKIFYSVDTHHHHEWHPLYGEIFNRVLVAQRSFLSAFRRPAFWFPPWATVYLEPQEYKTIDVCFRGTMNVRLNAERVAFFERLASLLPVDAGSGDYTKVYPSAKIVVNQAVKNDLNFRVFEALMSGALLLTPADCDGLNELFHPGEDLAVYHSGSPEDAAEQIRYFLEHDEERRRIAAAGRAKVLEYHTGEQRTQQLERHLYEIETEDDRSLLHHCVAEAYLFAVFVLNQKVSAPHHRLLEAAVHNCIESLERNEDVDFERRLGFALVLGNKIRSEKLNEDEIRLFRRLHASNPKSLLVAMGLIDALLADGKHTEAAEMARRYADPPDSLLAQIPDLMAEARGNFWSKTPAAKH
jgi:hypothetical protein